jgi:hypothetical protein
MFDFFSGPWDNRRTTRLVLLAVILMTLPCYCLGAVLLATAPSGGTATSVPANPTLGGSTALPVWTPTFTPFFTATFTPIGGPLQPTPPQIFLPTNTPFFFITNTPFPTWTPFQVTGAPSLTLAPSPTLAVTVAPSATLAPTNPPTNTLVPTNEPTIEAPTEAPTTEVPQATQPPPTQSEATLEPPTQEVFDNP